MTTEKVEFTRCKNCFGTGTVFRQKVLKVGGQRCPICRGACKVPVTKQSK